MDLNHNVEALCVHLIVLRLDLLLVVVVVVVPLLTRGQCRIENPLGYLTPEQLLRDVRDFARTKKLEEHLDLLKKGAQIAKDPRCFEVVRGITESEKRALHNESYRRFRQPAALYITIIVCCIGATVQ